jgi:hypothetical protein
MSKTTTTLQALLDAGKNEQMRQRSFGCACRKSTTHFILAGCLGLMAGALALPGAAQSAAIDAISAAAPENAANFNADAVQKVVRWNGTLPEAAGRTVPVRFALYQNQAGGLALWNETQTVKVGADGRYSVLLGVSSAEGLPQVLFDGGAARWVEVRLLKTGDDSLAEAEDTPAAPRNLLAAVPYAFKALNAETLAGIPAADYLTREDLQSAVASGIQVAAQANANSVSPALTGAGTTGALAYWSTGGNLASSVITQTPAGDILLGPASAATTAAGVNSPMLQMSASSLSYSYPTDQIQQENFGWQAVNTGNGTPNATANLDFLSSFNAQPLKPTGLSISMAGQITFVPGQKFPGASSITSVTAGTGLTGGGTAGPVTLSVNPALIPTLAGSNTFNGAANTFNGTTNFNGSTSAIIANAPSTTSWAIKATGGAVGISGTSTAPSGSGVLGYGSWGVNGQGSYGGVIGTSTAPSNGVGVFGQAQEQPGGIGVQGNGEAYGLNGASARGVGALGTSGGMSYTAGHHINSKMSIGVWGDSSVANTVFVASGIVGTADENFAGFFVNAGPTTTVFAYNGSGSTGLFKTLRASSPDGTCGFGSGGDLNCTGRVKALVGVAGGARKVETYALQSPENWMEDFGSGTLTRGAAMVKIDPAFAETVSETAEYHVFLTPKGDSKGLYVINVTAAGFEVRESGGGTSSLSFDYRIVGKRRGYEGDRLTDVTDKFNEEQKRAEQPLDRTEPANR